jgi:hypothetical protein
MNITDVKFDINQPLGHALDMALQIISMYESEINNSKDLFNINLVKIGFCQGVFFKGAGASIQGLVDKNMDGLFAGVDNLCQ